MEGNTHVKRKTLVRTRLTKVTPNPNGAGDGCSSKVFWGWAGKV